MATETGTVLDASESQQETGTGEERRPTKGTPRRLQFTVERQEMLEGVGITPKILRTWEEAGFFVPDLGPRTRRFTPRDVARLQFLKRLHEDLGLPKQVMQRLLSHFFYFPLTGGYKELGERRKRGQKAFPSDPARKYRLLDLKKIQLLDADKAFDTIVSDAADEDEKDDDGRPVIDEWLVRIATMVFHGLKWRHYGNSGVYEAARQDLIEQLKIAELAVRAEIRDGEIVSFSPACNDDPAEHSGPLADKIRESRSKLASHSYYDKVPF